MHFQSIVSVITKSYFTVFYLIGLLACKIKSGNLHTVQMNTSTPSPPHRPIWHTNLMFSLPGDEVFDPALTSCMLNYFQGQNLRNKPYCLPYIQKSYFTIIFFLWTAKNNIVAYCFLGFGDIWLWRRANARNVSFVMSSRWKFNAY